VRADAPLTPDTLRFHVAQSPTPRKAGALAGPPRAGPVSGLDTTLQHRSPANVAWESAGVPGPPPPPHAAESHPAVASARTVKPAGAAPGAEGPGSAVTTLLASAVGASIVQAVVSLYSRIPRDEILDQPLRRRVYDALRARKASTPSEIARDLGIAKGTARFHIETLQRADLVAQTRGVFHIPEASPPVIEPVARRVVALVAASPGLNMSEVARALGISKRTAQIHVLDLIEQGELSHRVDCGARLLYPKDS